MANKINVVLGLDVSQFTTGLNVAAKRMEQTSAKLISAGTTLSSAFTLPFAAITAGAIKVSADFEQAMSEVKAVSANVSDESFAQITEAAKELGRTTSKSATEAAQGLKFLALAGFTTEQQLAAIEPVLRLSEAGGIDLARASDLATDAMSALGIQAEKLGGFLDIVANTSTKSNSSIEQLNEAFIAVGGQFKNLNVPLDEANALLGILANRGTKGSEAGNGLSSVLINLTTGAGQAGDAMKELGISAFDTDGNFRGVSVILKDLNAKFSTLTLEQQTAYKAMIGGKTRITELNALLDGMANEFDDLRGSIQNSEGKLNDISKVMQDNLNGQVTRLKSALEGLGIQMGEVLLPVVKSVADSLQGLLDRLSETSPETTRFALIIGGIAAAIGPVLIAIGALTKVAAVLTVGLATATKAAIALKGALTSTAGIVGLVVAAIAAIAVEQIRYAKSIDGTLQARKRLEEVEKTALKNTVKQKTEVALLVEKLKDEKTTLDQRAKIISQLNDISPEYFGGLKESETLYTDATKAADLFNAALIRTARIQAAKEQLVELEKQLLDVGEAAKPTFFQGAIAGVKAFGNVAVFAGNLAKQTLDNVKDVTASLEAQRDALLKVIGAEEQRAEAAKTPTFAAPALPDTPAGKAIITEIIDPLAVEKAKFVLESLGKASQIIAEKTKAEFNAAFRGLADVAAEPISPIERTAEAIKKYEEELRIAEVTARVFGQTTGDLLKEKLNVAEAALKSAIKNFPENSALIEKLTEDFEKLKEAIAGLGGDDPVAGPGDKIKAFIKDLEEKYGPAVQSFDALLQQSFANRSAAIEDYYAKERQRIEGSVASEEQKARAIGQLDEEVNRRKKKLARDQALRDKAKAIYAAIINTASAIAEVLPNLPLAATIGAFGAAQVALIASQKLPAFARGGMVTGEQLAIVGDNPSGKEAIIPFERMGEFLDMAGGGGTRVTGLFEVRGQDLILVLDRATQSKNRIR